MKCPVCGSENVNVQIVTETELKNKQHGVVWWLLIGWWLVPIWWLCFTIPALMDELVEAVKILHPRMYTTFIDKVQDL